MKFIGKPLLMASLISAPALTEPSPNSFRSPIAFIPKGWPSDQGSLANRVSEMPIGAVSAIMLRAFMLWRAGRRQPPRSGSNRNNPGAEAAPRAGNAFANNTSHSALITSIFNLPSA